MTQHKGARASVKREVRVIATPQKFELRKNADGSRSVTGYFAMFNTLSHDMGFREKLLPGCFKRSLQQNPVSCLFNHLDDRLLGRSESGTLKVWEDNIGLRFDVKLPDTTYAADLIALMERGDAYECSFGFAIPDGGDTWMVMPDGTLLRTISEAILFEGSILVSPAAYPNTSASLRSLPAALRNKLNKRDGPDDCDEDKLDEDGNCPDDEEDSRADQCKVDDPELDTLRLRLRIAQHRAKRFPTH
jgi:hypothetical protein